MKKQTEICKIEANIDFLSSTNQSHLNKCAELQFH